MSNEKKRHQKSEMNTPEDQASLKNLMSDTFDRKEKGLNEAVQDSSESSSFIDPQKKQSHSAKESNKEPIEEKRPIEPTKNEQSIKKSRKPVKPFKENKTVSRSQNMMKDLITPDPQPDETSSAVHISHTPEGRLSDDLQKQTLETAHEPKVEASPQETMKNLEQVATFTADMPDQRFEIQAAPTSETEIAAEDAPSIQIQFAVAPEEVGETNSPANNVQTAVEPGLQRDSKSVPKDQVKATTPAESTSSSTPPAQPEIQAAAPPTQQAKPTVSVDCRLSDIQKIKEQEEKIKRLSNKLSNLKADLAAEQQNFTEKEHECQKLLSQLKSSQERLEVLENKILQGNLALESKDNEINCLKSQIETARITQALEIAVHFGPLLQTLADLTGQDPEKTEGLSLMRIYHTLQDSLKKASGVKPTRFPIKGEYREDDSSSLVITLDADLDCMAELQQIFDWSPEKPFEGLADGQKKRNFRLLHWGWRLGKKVIARAIVSVLPEPVVNA